MKWLLLFLFKKSIDKYLKHNERGANIYYISEKNNWTLDYTLAVKRLVEYLNLK